MNLFGHDISFWVALIGATAIRVFTSPFHSIARAALMIFISAFLAWALTDGVVHWLSLNPDVYKTPVAALIALSADGTLRLWFTWLANPSIAIDLWNQFRGQGEKGDKK